MAKPDFVNFPVDLREGPSGGILTWTVNRTVGELVISFPPGSMWKMDEARLWPTPEPLNEFGYLYVALYIAGNYARYYPDRWIADVEASTPLGLAIEQLMSTATERMALLTLSELMQTYYIPGA
jgi:hypothetical protein